MPKRTRQGDTSDAPPVKLTSRQQDIANNKKAEEERLKKEAEKAAERRAQLDAARASRPAGTGEYCGDGKLHLAFIPVGQGDCAIMSTPEGRVVLFDCGSDSLENETDAVFRQRVQDIVADQKFMGKTNSIDILITTHPDSDHYNKLKAVLGDKCKIAAWYHSLDRVRYAQAQTSSYLVARLGGIEQGAMRVVVNDDPPTVQGETTINGKPPSGGGGATDPAPDINGGIRILKETKRDCTITILAAGVEHLYDKDNSNETNRGSIVTLIECDGKKVLICGDATINTEQFLLNTARDRFKNVDVLQAGHHGSINTSTSLGFSRATNPALVVASAGSKIPMHNLPSKEVLTRYQFQLALASRRQITEHKTYCYEPAGMGSYIHTFVSSTYEVFTTGSRGLVEVTI